MVKELRVLKLRHKVSEKKKHIKNISTNNIKLKVSVCDIYMPIDHSVTNNWWILTDKNRCSRNAEDVKALNIGKEHNRQQSGIYHCSQAEFLVHLDNEACVMSTTGFY